MNNEEKLTLLFNDFVKDMKDLFAADLVSVIAHGSAVSEDFDARRSDINMLVCLKDDKPSILNKYISLWKKWAKKRMCTPLFMTEEYIRESLDVFPIEFINFRARYKVLYGKDVLANLVFQKQHVRHELEREFKGKLVHLKLAFIEASDSCERLRALINSSMHVILPLFRGMLYLVDEKKNIISKSELIQEVCSRYALDTDLMKTLYSVSTGKEKLPKENVADIFDRLIGNVHRIVTTINNMEVSR